MLTDEQIRAIERGFRRACRKGESVRLTTQTIATAAQPELVMRQVLYMKDCGAGLSVSYVIVSEDQLLKCVDPDYAVRLLHHWRGEPGYPEPLDSVTAFLVARPLTMS